MTRRVVLVGAGPAHLHVLREWRRRPLSDVDLTLVAPDTAHHGALVPGFLAGARDEAALRVDVAGLARCAGARHLRAEPRRVRGAAGIVEAADETLTFELCSIDVVAEAPDGRVPGAREHAFAVRAGGQAVALRARLDALIASGRPFALLVAGAGAVGVETAFAVQARIAAAGAPGAVTLADAGPVLLPHEPAGMRARVLALLRERSIGVVLGGAIARVDAASVSLTSGASLPASLVAWTLDAAPPPLLAASDLARDERGVLRVDRSLRVAGTGVFGATDCATSYADRPAPWPATLAATQGPVLLANLRAALGAGRPRAWRPRHGGLQLLDTADGSAVARWGAFHGAGAWAGGLRRRAEEGAIARLRAACDETPVRGS